MTPTEIAAKPNEAIHHLCTVTIDNVTGQIREVCT